MHALSRVNTEFPAGDRGGNSFPLKNHYSISELHALWDSVIYEFHVNDKLVFEKKLNYFFSPIPRQAGTSSEKQ